jgi:phage major head subunit gpT-like protein
MAVKATVLQAADTLFRTLFTRALSTAASRHKLVCMIVPSTTKENVYGWLAALPAIKKVIGEYGRKQLQQLGYRLTNEKFGGIVDVPQEDFDDDQLGTYSPAISSWGERAAFVPDTELTDVMCNAFSVTLGKDYTGAAFFGTAKKAFPKATAWSNKDTKKLSAANFEAGLAVLQERVDAEGVPLYLGLEPTKLLLVVCSTDRATADAIVAKTLAAGGDNPNYAKATVVVWPGLETRAATLIGAGARPWFLLDVSKEVKPFILQEREKFALTSLVNPTSQQVFDQDKFSWKVRGRMAVGYGLPETAFGSTGADAA